MGDMLSIWSSTEHGQELPYIPLREISRLRMQLRDRFTRAEVLADVFRLNTLYMIMRAGSGHIGSSLSSLDIVTWLWTAEMKRPNETKRRYADLYFSSKGHDAPGLYAVFTGLGKIDFEYLHKLRRLGGLAGHPRVETPYILTNTGSLGMGLSKAHGMALGRRMRHKKGRIFVLMGDGELQEGQFWESLLSAVNGRFSEITVIIDHNKIQSDTFVREVGDLGDLTLKLRSFGCAVVRCDGHDQRALARAFRRLKDRRDKVGVLIADTTKGKGVAFMERMAPDGFYKFHSGAPRPEDFQAGIAEIKDRINRRLASIGVGALELDSAAKPSAYAPRNSVRLVSVYGDELVNVARGQKEIVALDADLVLDTGLIPFKKAFPKRFIECGIAEQDMVSIAGGLALQGMLPVVHSFAAFLSTRPNEHLYNNATEHTKIVYVASLAGLLPAAPGHSHQSVRDISSVGAIPGLVLLQPSCERETRLALRWAIEKNRKSTYIRLTSLPHEPLVSVPSDYTLKLGRGVMLRRGTDVLLIGYGPIMLGEALKAADALKASGLSLAVLNMPWLNRLDCAWLSQIIRRYGLVVTLDDHYAAQGQGSFITSELVKVGVRLPPLIRMGIETIPGCGQPEEVLAFHQLDGLSIAAAILQALRGKTTRGGKSGGSSGTVKINKSRAQKLGYQDSRA